MLDGFGTDLFGLAAEADCLAAKVRNARCCDALRPCRSCRFLRQCVLARRLVIRVPRAAGHTRSVGPSPVTELPAAPARLQLLAS